MFSTICFNGLMIGLKCLSNVISSSILLVFKVRYYLQIESLVFAISLVLYLLVIFAAVHINVSLSIDHIMESESLINFH